MPGQLSNFMKNFGKFIYTETQPFIPVMKAFKTGGEIAGDIFWNLNKLDNPKINDMEKSVLLLTWLLLLFLLFLL
jgi:hypothetical protein